MQMDVIMHVIKENKLEIPVIWIDRKLHNNPKKLHTHIQEQINANQHVEEIILSYGLCGNAVIGLYSKHTKLILPAFDDCICQILYMEKDGLIINRGIPQKGCYYLTREWTIDQESIVQQCNDIYEQYGKEYGSEIIQEIFGRYHSLTIIDTGAYDVNKICGYVNKAAKYTGMRVKKQKGSCKVIENLLLGDYNENICVFCKGERIGIRDFKHSGVLCASGTCSAPTAVKRKICS